MKPEELCEYAAKDILNLNTTYRIDFDGGRTDVYVTSSGREYCEIGDWHPDTDYTQLRMVEEAVGHPFQLSQERRGDPFEVLAYDYFAKPVKNDSELLARLELAVLCHKEAQGE